MRHNAWPVDGLLRVMQPETLHTFTLKADGVELSSYSPYPSLEHHVKWHFLECHFLAAFP